jgi:hypothetical protein
VSPWTIPHQHGTLDRAILIPEQNRLIINDLKWGRGIPVSPVRNKQMVLYALGFWDSCAWQALDMNTHRAAGHRPTALRRRRRLLGHDVRRA